MHILITVHCSDLGRTKAPQTAQCTVVFAAFDGVGNPTKVIDWTPLTMLELQRHRQARLRMRARRRIEDAMAAETYSAQGTASSATLRFRAASTDIESDGTVRGGRVMRWLDEAGHACGAAWAGINVVTSYVAGIRLSRTISVDHVVDVTARIIRTGRRSIHIGIRAVTADAAGQPLLVAHGVIVVVCLGAHGEAQPVPQWQPVLDEDRRLDRHARHLIGN
jgi:acyl-CoA hydrolase